jgi:methionyl-tRNA formyltransferase
MAGDAVTGVTIIRLDEGLDTGPVLTAQAVDILPEENAGDLAERLSRIGASLLNRALPEYLGGDMEPTAQSNEGVTVAPKIGASERSLDHDDDPMIFLGRVRALAPTPGATLRLDGSTHKVLEARLSTKSAGPGEWRADGGGPIVDVGGTGVELTILQPPGKRPQRGEDWVRGRHRASGAVR